MGEQQGRPLPLIAWGEAMHRRRLERRRRVTRWTAVLAPILVAVSLSTVLPTRPRLVWNASASAPIGLYVVMPGRPLRRGDMVIARVPAAVRRIAAIRHYVPANVPLVKHVGGIPGDLVCARGAVVSIDARRVAVRRTHDGSGRPMMWWQGCRHVGQSEVFLLSPVARASFDGRYFGISPSTDVIGLAKLIWAW